MLCSRLIACFSLTAILSLPSLAPLATAADRPPKCVTLRLGKGAFPVATALAPDGESLAIAACNVSLSAWDQKRPEKGTSLIDMDPRRSPW